MSCCGDSVQRKLNQNAEKTNLPSITSEQIQFSRLEPFERLNDGYRVNSHSPWDVLRVCQLTKHIISFPYLCASSHLLNTHSHRHLFVHSQLAHRTNFLKTARLIQGDQNIFWVRLICVWPRQASRNHDYSEVLRIKLQTLLTSTVLAQRDEKKIGFLKDCH